MKIKAGLDALEIKYAPDAPERLERYLDLLFIKNEKMNLTAVNNREEAVVLHILDSAALFKFADMSGSSLIDVGSGAGLPGMALKIIDPTIRLTFLDSQQKRVDFLRECCEEIGLPEVYFVCARAEEYAGEFDFATARAVAKLNVLCELCLPLLSKDGRFLAMKAQNSAEEIADAQNAIKTLGGEMLAVHSYDIPGMDISRRVVDIKKTGSTPEKYPRRYAKIIKNPL